MEHLHLKFFPLLQNLCCEIRSWLITMKILILLPVLMLVLTSVVAIPQNNIFKYVKSPFIRQKPKSRFHKLLTVVKRNAVPISALSMIGAAA